MPEGSGNAQADSAGTGGRIRPRRSHVAGRPFRFSERTAGSSQIPLAKALREIVQRAQEQFGGAFGKFLVVGGIGFLLQTVILRVLVGMRVDPAIASLSGAVVAIFSNFNLNNLWTFRSDRIEGSAPYLRKMASFYATSAIGVLLIQTGVIFVGDETFGRSLYFAYFVLGTALLVAYNFSVYRLVIWRTTA